MPEPSKQPTPASGKRELRVIALAGVPLVQEGDDLAAIVIAALARSGEKLESGDVLVLAQKIVSKATGCHVDLANVAPSPRALELSEVVGKDPRVIELVLRESKEVLRARRDVIVVEHRLGFVMANAGIDFSNVEGNAEPGPAAHAMQRPSAEIEQSGKAEAAQETRALLLPRDPDAECRKLRDALRASTHADVAVIINDSHGRAWRNGTVGVAIGSAGMAALLDLRGKPDLFGRTLRITQVGLADELAAAASLLMGQSDEGTPIVLIRGVPSSAPGGSAADLIRPKALDMFR